jgi:exopolyphosphatase/guanosine-5'-triphosphate,3'-diphosphate pyrophosphatase
MVTGGHRITAMRYGPRSACSPNCNISPVIAAAIDVGTNTTRLLVARVESGRITPLATGGVMTALGTGLEQTGRITEAGLELVEQIVATMAVEARALGAERIAIACTAVGRDATNAPELLSRIAAATGVTAHVLSGEREAELAFAGLVADGASDPLVAADLGGGSLELMGGVAGRLTWATSLPIGVRKLTERYVTTDPPTPETRAAITDAVLADIAPIATEHPARAMLVTGGSAAALSRLAGTAHLDEAALSRAAELLTGHPANDLAEPTGLEPARLRLCFAGAAALDGLRRAFALDALDVSTAGLREGLVLEATL